MKYLLYASVVLGLIYVGIKYFGAAGPSKQVTETVGKMKQSEIKALAVKKASQLAQIKSAIQNFRAAEERLPVSLQELKDYDYIGSVPGGLSYNPATGEVSETQ